MTTPTSTPEPFKIMIFGGRDFTDYNMLVRVMAQLAPKFPDDRELQIISGMARGADALAIRFAEEHELKLLPFPANWKPNGVLDRGAGYKRNTLMVNACDIGIGFHDGHSKGTAHSIRELQRVGKEIHLIRY